MFAKETLVFLPSQRNKIQQQMFEKLRANAFLDVSIRPKLIQMQILQFRYKNKKSVIDLKLLTEFPGRESDLLADERKKETGNRCLSRPFNTI